MPHAAPLSSAPLSAAPLSYAPRPHKSWCRPAHFWSRLWLLAAVLACGDLTAAELSQPTAAERYQRDRWLAAALPMVCRTADPGGARLVVLEKGPAWWDRVQQNGAWTRRFRLAKQTYDHGLFTHAPSRLQVELPEPAVEFVADLGIASHGTVIFTVSTTGQELFRSDVVVGRDARVPVRVALGGARQFTLAVEDAGDSIPGDHAIWAGAQVVLESGKVLRLGDLPVMGKHEPTRFSDRLPFDFELAGEPFSELAGQWPVTLDSAELDAARTLHTLSWSDESTGLVVRCDLTVYHDFPTVEWVTSIQNTGTAPSPILSNLQGLTAGLTRPPTERYYGEFGLHHQTGSQGSRYDYQLHKTELLPAVTKRIATSGGRSSNASWPYMNLQWGHEGMLIALGWSGQWAIDFVRDGAGGLKISGGQEKTHLRLEPGEQVRLPTVVLQFYQGDRIRSQNVWRRWMRAHVVPRTAGKPPTPQLAAGSARVFGWMGSATEENQIEFIRRWVDAGVDLDYWWMDTGWYGDIWKAAPDRFPQGIRPISDFAHQHDLGTILWFEPERITPEATWIRENHPEWVLSADTTSQGLFDFGNPAALAWMNDRIDAELTDNQIDFYRVDFNMDPLEHWRQNDAPDRQGMTENLWVQGFYAHWDELRRRNPQLKIDSCASGGRRNDLETMRRAIPLWRSDYTDRSWIPDTRPKADEPSGMQCQNYGLSLWLPFHGQALDYPDPYVARSYFSPCVAMNVNLQDDTYDLAELKKRIAEWRQVAPYLACDFYPLTRYHHQEDNWMIFQFDDPRSGGGAIMAFQRTENIYPAATIRPRSLVREASYTVTDLDGGETQQQTGGQLMDEGLLLWSPEAGTARILRYQRQ